MMGMDAIIDVYAELYRLSGKIKSLERKIEMLNIGIKDIQETCSEAPVGHSGFALRRLIIKKCGELLGE